MAEKLEGFRENPNLLRFDRITFCRQSSKHFDNRNQMIVLLLIRNAQVIDEFEDITVQEIQEIRI